MSISKSANLVFDFGDGASWMGYDNTMFLDNANVSTEVCADEASSTLYFSDFDFALPADALIQGIQINLVKTASGNNELTDQNLQLYFNDEPIGENKARPEFWALIPFQTMYGGPTDLWGESITREMVLDSTFGFIIRLNPAAGSCENAFIDLATLRVTYTLPKPCEATDDSTAITSCGPMVSPSGNQTWTASGFYTDTLVNAGGCDSVLFVDLAIIDVNAEFSFNGLELTAQQEGLNYQWFDCTSGLALPGATAQTFTPTMSGSCGLTVDLGGCIDSAACTIVCLATEGTLVADACMNYETSTGLMVTESGTYTDTTVNAAGCDSIITFIVTIWTSANTEVIQSGTTLSAQAVGASYTWVDCDDNFAPIAGAILPDFVPSESGNYAVIIDQGGCIDTSGCFAVEVMPSSTQQLNTDAFQLYPNPARDQITIRYADEQSINSVTVLVLDGREVHSRWSGSEVNVSGLEGGLYFCRIETANGFVLRKFVVERN